MNCQKCKSQRVASVTAKCSDCCGVSLGAADLDGYVPGDMGIGGGDYVEFSYCLDCGQLQGKFPLETTEIEKDILDSEVTEFFENYFTEGYEIDYFNRNRIHQIVEAAKDHDRKFGKFVGDFLRFNVGSRPPLKFPSAQKFVEMYRSNRSELE
jgi:hypothetical protein